MKDILGEIQSGEFAREWIAENRAGQENFQRMRTEEADHQVEREGKELRSMMDWIETDVVVRGAPSPAGSTSPGAAGSRGR